MNFYDAWWFIHSHPMNYDDNAMNYGLAFLDIAVMKVDPKTRTIQDNMSLNTHTEIWLEFGPMYKLPSEDFFPDIWQRSHDINLDCGADTFEEAIIKLAGLIKLNYKGQENG